uniref:(northern house mosquito) hypothetical protein n=1 Tax=Culex pipiens TaxID=7175 RepID=A0A8D8MQ00_CULPI
MMSVWVRKASPRESRASLRLYSVRLAITADSSDSWYGRYGCLPFRATCAGGGCSSILARCCSVTSFSSASDASSLSSANWPSPIRRGSTGGGGLPSVGDTSIGSGKGAFRWPFWFWWWWWLW